MRAECLEAHRQAAAELAGRDVGEQQRRVRARLARVVARVRALVPVGREHAVAPQVLQLEHDAFCDAQPTLHQVERAVHVGAGHARLAQHAPLGQRVLRVAPPARRRAQVLRRDGKLRARALVAQLVVHHRARDRVHEVARDLGVRVDRELLAEGVGDHERVRGAARRDALRDGLEPLHRQLGERALLARARRVQRAACTADSTRPQKRSIDASDWRASSLGLIVSGAGGIVPARRAAGAAACRR